jgi:hypothetical protein
VTIPYTIQYSVGVERQLAAKTTVAVTFIGSRGFDMFRSRDVNAPAPPLFLERPDPAYGVVREIESAGTMRTATLQFTLRGASTRFNGTAQYSYGRAYNDTSGIGWVPPNAYDLSQEYGPADFDRRHTIELFGSWTAGRWFTLGASAEAFTGRPYSLTLGTDVFNTGTANARPLGVARNSLRGPGYASLDLRWSHDVVLPGPKKRSVALGIDAFNVLNRVNESSFVGNLSSPFFGRAVSASAPRRVQFSLRTRL